MCFPVVVPPQNVVSHIRSPDFIVDFCYERYFIFRYVVTTIAFPSFRIAISACDTNTFIPVLFPFVQLSHEDLMASSTTRLFRFPSGGCY